MRYAKHSSSVVALALLSCLTPRESFHTLFFPGLILEPEPRAGICGQEKLGQHGSLTRRRRPSVGTRFFFLREVSEHFLAKRKTCTREGHHTPVLSAYMCVCVWIFIWFNYSFIPWVFDAGLPVRQTDESFNTSKRSAWNPS